MTKANCTEIVTIGNTLFLSALWASDGKSFATTSMDCLLRLWDASGEKSYEFIKFADTCPHFLLSFERNSETRDYKILSISTENFLWKCDTEKLEAEKFKLEVADDFSTLYAHASSDGKRVVATCSWSSATNSNNSNTPRVWSIEDGKEIFRLHGHTGIVTCARWSPDNSSIITASIDGKCILWNAKETPGKIMRQIECGAQIFSTSWSPDGSMFFSGSKLGGFISKNATDSERLCLKEATGKIFYSAWSPDKKMICTTSILGEVRVWDSAYGELLFELQAHMHAVIYCAWTSDESRLMTMSKDKTIAIWKLEKEH